MQEPRSANSVRQENSRHGQRDASARMPTYYNIIIMQLRAHKKPEQVLARANRTLPRLCVLTVLCASHWIQGTGTAS